MVQGKQTSQTVVKESSEKSRTGEQSVQEALHYLEKQLKNKVDDFVLSASQGEKTQIKFANDSIATTQSWESRNIEIFANWKQRLVSTNAQDLREPALSKAVHRLLLFAQKSEANSEYSGIAQGSFRYTHKPVVDKRVHELENPMEYVRDALAAAHDHGAERSAGVFEFSQSTYSLLSSGGAQGDGEDTSVYLSIRSHKGNGSGYSNQVGRSLHEIDAQSAGASAADVAVRSQRAEPVAAGIYDVIFSEYPFANIAMHFGTSALISEVETKTSFLADMLGKQVTASGITLYDDATLPHGLASRPFDDEGVPSQKTTIVNKGILQTYLHNTSTAKRYNTQTTANAGLVSPDNSTLVIKGLEVPEQRLFEDFSGLHITNVWYMRFQNYLAGNFSTIPRDGIFLYKKGELVGAVKDIRVTDTMLRFFQHIRAQSNTKVQQCGWEVDDPVVCGKVLVSGVPITRSTQ